MTTMVRPQFLVGLIMALALASCQEPAYSGIPDRCKSYRDMIHEVANAYEFPPAVVAAQITQESGCRPRAQSPWAKGFAQFTDATAGDMRNWYPQLLANFDVWHPEQATLALVLYMRRLRHMFRDAASNCDRYAMALSGYNSGPGWTLRDRRVCRQVSGCDAGRWWGHVELHHDSRRRPEAIRESTEYPKRILRRWQPEYVSAGWAGPLVCKVKS